MGFDRLAGALQAQGDSTKKKRPVLEPDDFDARERRAKIDTLYTIGQRSPAPSERRRGARPDPADDRDFNRLSGELGKLKLGEYLSMLLRKPNTGPRAR